MSHDKIFTDSNENISQCSLRAASTVWCLIKVNVIDSQNCPWRVLFVPVNWWECEIKTLNLLLMGQKDGEF